MPGLPLRVYPRLPALALVALAVVSSGVAAAQPSPPPPSSAAQPSPSAPSPSAQPSPPASPPVGTPPVGASPGQPAPPGGAPPYAGPAAPVPGAAPPGVQPWYPQPPEGVQPWAYYPQYGYGYDNPYLAPPPPPREPYNRTYMIAGITMTVAGVLGLIVGAVVVASAKERIDVYCDGPFLCARIDDNVRKGVGIGTMIVGGVAATVGIPLWIVGGRRVPVRKKDGAPNGTTPSAPPAAGARLLPELRVGPTSASLAFQF